MKKLLILLLLGGFINNYISSQNLATKSIDISQQFNVYAVNQQLKDYAVFGLDMKPIAGLQHGAHNQIQSLEVQFNVGEFNTTLHLVNSGIIHSSYQRRTASGEEIRTAVPSPMSGYTSEGQPIRFTVNTGYFHGYIQTENTRYYIEPLWIFDNEASKDLYIVYDVNDSYQVEKAECGVKTPEGFKEDAPHRAGEVEAEECYEVEYALASDYLLYQKKGSIEDVENYMVAVTNDMETNYDDEFSDGISYVIVETYIVDCSGCDPWTQSTDAGAFLDSFSSWARGTSGFSAHHDIGSVWTGRDFDGKTIGIAWINGLCSYYRYNALSNFTNYSEYLRVLVAHEIGHNWGCFHDPEGAPYIMAPVVSASTDWSTESENVINATLVAKKGGDCLESCPEGNELPKADFYTQNREICEGNTIQFFDNSENATSYEWTFQGGTPSTSTEQNPDVNYSQAGQYDVSLTVYYNSESDTETKYGYINVKPSPIASFTSNSDGLVVEFTSTSTNGESYLWNFGDNNTSTAENPVHVYAAGGDYTVTLEVKNDCGEDIYIQDVTTIGVPIADFIADNTEDCKPLTVLFSSNSMDAETYLWTFEGGIPESSTAQNVTVTYEEIGNYDVTLKVKNSTGEDIITKNNYISVIDVPIAGFNSSTQGLTVEFSNSSVYGTHYLWNFGNGATSNAESPTYTYQDAGIYTVKLTAYNECGSDEIVKEVEVGDYPQADFTASHTKGCITMEVEYESEFDGEILAYSWIFEGGTPATSTEERPTVLYYVAGTYDVQLIVENSLGKDTLLRKNYITVSDVPLSKFSYSTQGLIVQFMEEVEGDYTDLEWSFGDGSTSTDKNPTHIYAAYGTYTVKLTVSNACGEDSYAVTFSLNESARAAFDVSQGSGCVPFTLHFQNNSTGDDLSFLWIFESGEPYTSQEKEPTVTYNQAGEYTVTLVAYNGFSTDTLVREKYITVFPLPIAGFEYEIKGDTVQFTQMSENAEGVFWDFGNGETSQEAEPQIKYGTSGDYSVQLIASNACGQDTITKQISVITATQNPNELAFKVYPNPIAERLFIDMSTEMKGEYDVKLISISGMKILNERISVSDRKQIQMEVKDIPAGTYILEIRNEAKVGYKKLIKQ